MKSDTKKTRLVLVLAAALMLGLAQYPAAAQVLGPNSINNETVDTGHDPHSALDLQHGGTGLYDRYDKYRTPQGFPLPGWGHLRGMS